MTAQAPFVNFRTFQKIIGTHAGLNAILNAEQFAEQSHA
jgi:hypothetical protein